MHAKLNEKYTNFWQIPNNNSGNALIFNNDVQITGNSSEPVTNPAVNGFDYTFPTMQDGEEITITYTASIDPEKASKILPVIGDEADCREFYCTWYLRAKGIAVLWLPNR